MLAAESTSIRWLVRLALGATILVISACGGDDGPRSDWAIIKVEVAADVEPLRSICLGDAGCRTFEREGNVRIADFAAWVPEGTRFEVETYGSGSGGSGAAPLGGCVLVQAHSGGTTFVGCTGAEEG